MAAVNQSAYGNTLRRLVLLVFIYMVTYALSLNVHGLFYALRSVHHLQIQSCYFVYWRVVCILKWLGSYD